MELERRAFVECRVDAVDDRRLRGYAIVFNSRSQNLGGFTEVIEKTGGGLLTEPDDPASLAAAILRIYMDPALAGQLGQNGYQKVREHYSVARMADRALEAYESVLIDTRARVATDLHG